MKNDEQRSTHWDLMKETAEEVASLKDGTHARLKAEFLEEFGQLPSSEVLDYFDDILKSDIEKTRLKSSHSDTRSNLDHSSDTVTKTETPSSSPSEELYLQVSDMVIKEDRTSTQEVPSEAIFAEKFATNTEATVLRFRKAFEKNYGKEPSLEIVAHFLKILALNKNENKENLASPVTKEEPSKETFIKQFIQGPAPTVKRFREAFEKIYGSPPEGQWITEFLNSLSKKKQ